MDSLNDRRLIFAGQITDVVPPQADLRLPWRLTIDAESFVIMTSTHHCDELGLNENAAPDLTAILDRQREFVASSTDWQDRVLTSVRPTVEEAAE